MERDEHKAMCNIYIANALACKEMCIRIRWWKMYETFNEEAAEWVGDACVRRGMFARSKNERCLRILKRCLVKSVTFDMNSGLGAVRWWGVWW